MLDVLLDPWRDELTRRALAEVTLLGIAGGALGCWIVHLRLAYAAESLAHGLLPGLVVAALTGIPLLAGGAAGLALAALGVAVAGRLPALDQDTAVAVVVTTLLGLGGLLALSAQTPPGLGDLLFGDVLATGDGDLALAAATVAVVLAALWLLHPSLLAVTFDRAIAPALGRPPFTADVAVALLLALVLLVAVQGLGNLLVVAVLVGPAAAARLVTRRMAPMIAVAAGVAVAGGLAGLYVSYHGRTAAGASVAAALVAAWALTAAATHVRGLRT
ncbi:MAG TPA: metal ABC transporter permease [Baekduia sp.]|nr:metal ABC transporter permease [Baekduia sp.]